jgi:hypothetical protein
VANWYDGKDRGVYWNVGSPEEEMSVARLGQKGNCHKEQLCVSLDVQRAVSNA